MPSVSLSRLKKPEEVLAPSGRWFVFRLNDNAPDKEALIEAERARLAREQGYRPGDDVMIILRDFVAPAGAE
jgi:hypothetical protein